MATICVHWPRLGPYHVARLRAAHELLAGSGDRLVLLETAESDATYAWELQRDELPFPRVRAFEDRQLETISVGEMVSGVHAALDRIDPDAVAITSYSHPDARASLTWCRRRRRTAVLMTDSKADDAPRVGWREWVKRQLVTQYDAAIVAGTAHATYARALGMPATHTFRPVDVVDNQRYANGADAARAEPLAAAESIRLEIGRPYFLCVARMVERKNLATLIRAYGAYRRTCRDAGTAPWSLVLVGDGPERDRLRQLADEACDGGVMFAGFRQTDELVTFLGLAECLVHPARMDQWGLVVNEAMAAGLPVLVSRAAGCADDLVVDGVTGHRFDPDSAEELASLLSAVSALPPGERQRMANAGRQRIERYRPEDFAIALRDAVTAGSQRSGRGLSPTAWVVTTALQMASRDARAFHSIPD